VAAIWHFLTKTWLNKMATGFCQSVWANISEKTQLLKIYMKRSHNDIRHNWCIVKARASRLIWRHSTTSMWLQSCCFLFSVHHRGNGSRSTVPFSLRVPRYDLLRVHIFECKWTVVLSDRGLLAGREMGLLSSWRL